MTAATILVDNLPLHNITSKSLMERIESAIKSRHPISIATVNPEFIVAAHRDKKFFDTLVNFDYRIVDGSGIMLLTRIFTRQHFVERVTGSDMTTDLLKMASENGHRIMLLGGTAESSALAGANIKKKYPNILIDCFDGGIINPNAIKPEVLNRIEEFAPDILLVALGMRKQEYFIESVKQKFTIPVMIGVGGTIDFLSGTIKRAPKIIKTLYLEWLWRLILQPSRIKRIGQAVFIFPWIYIAGLLRK